MILRLLILSFLVCPPAMAQEGGPRLTIIEGAELVCRTPGRVVYVNKKDERMWMADPGASFGHEPTILKFLNTGKKSLFIKAEAQLFDEKVGLLFTLRDVMLNGEVLQTGLRATLRILDSTGEESAILRFRCTNL